MAEILNFIKKRVEVVGTIAISLGMIFSIKYLFNSPISTSALIYLVLGISLFIIELRFMDEIKDFEKDKIANPTRPLPAGEISKKQVLTLIIATYLILILLCCVGYFFFSPLVGSLYALVVAWLTLMYYEFGIPKILNLSPIVYAISHQVIILPLCFFVVAVLAPNNTFSPQAIGYSMLILGSFFSFEVGRKMNPEAHSILGTYRVYYGKVTTHLFISLLIGLCLLGASQLGVFPWVLVPSIIVFVFQFLIFKNEKIFKIFEYVMTLNLLYNLWVLAIVKGFVA